MAKRSKQVPVVQFRSVELLAAFGLLADEQTREEQRVALVKEEYEKLLILCDHFGIDTSSPFSWHQLAWTLARQLYPEKKKSGAKQKWSGWNGGPLVVEIKRLVVTDEPTHGVSWAAEQLATRQPWKAALEGRSNPPEVLRRAYYAFHETRWAVTAAHAFAMYELEDNTDQWDRYVAFVVKNC